METITIEEKKRLAEWMGWEFKEGGNCDDYKDTEGQERALFQWTPEKGGKDLTEVLANLSLAQKDRIFYDVFPSVLGGWKYEDSYLAFFCWAQNPKNAPTIIKTVLKVI